MFSTKQLSRAGAMVIVLAGLVITSVSRAALPPPAQVGILNVIGDKVSGGDIQYQFDVNAVEPGTLGVKATIKGRGLRKTSLIPITPGVSAGLSTVTGPVFTLPSAFVGTAVIQAKITFNGRKLATKSVIISVTAPPPPGALTVSKDLRDVGFENSITLDGGIVPTTGMGAVTYTWIQTTGKTVALSATDVAAPTFTTDALTNFVNMGTSINVNDIDDAGFTNLLYVTPEHRFSTLIQTGNAKGLALDYEQSAAATYGFKVLVSNGSVTRTGLFTVVCSSATPAHPNIPVGVSAYIKDTDAGTNSWVLLSKPDGSAATLAHSGGLVAELRPDVEGVYIVQNQSSPRYATSITTKTNALHLIHNEIYTNYVDAQHVDITTFLTNSSTKTVTNVAALDRWTAITNTAASWTGVEFCAVCHGPGNNVGQEDIYTKWSKTGHASFFKEAVDGIKSSHYSKDCISCHVVGYNKATSAVNGGFDDVASDLGWSFPSTLTAGNWDAMPAALQNKSNIQCESCHGPGSRHPGEPSVSMNAKVCAQCHQDGSHHVRPQQWEISPHAGGYENISNSRGTNPQCSRCHSPVGFKDVASGNVLPNTTNSVTTAAGPLTCQACHDPHDKFDNDERHQLRSYDTALLGNPYYRTADVTIALGETITTDDPRMTNANLKVTGLGNSATCIACHNGRQLPTQAVIYGTNTVMSAKTLRPTTIGVTKFYQIGGPHDQLAGEAFMGVGMFDYGQQMGNSFHTYLASCQACHMYQIKAGDVIMTNDIPVTITAGNIGNYANLIGNHTFKMDYVQVAGNRTNVIDNIAACNQCHDSFETVESFDFKPANAKDYDGNGTIEGIQTETHGMLNNLGYLLSTTGVTITTNDSGQVTSVSTSAGYATNNVALVEAQSKAAWNFLAVYREGSFGVHNTQYTTRLLQTSYTDLSTNWGIASGGPTNTYQMAFPKAYLR